MVATILSALALVSTAPGEAAQVSNLRDLFSGDDYPPAAILLQQQGTTAIRLSIDPGGRVTDCFVEESSGSSVLDAKTCSIFQTRARFRPARDSSGRPTADTYRERISWKLEDAELPIDAWTFRIVARLSGDRRRQDCGLDAGGALKDEAVGMAPCAEFAGALKIPPELLGRGRGKKTILVFDQQFVPRVVDSIATPRDLRRYTLVGREVVKIQIGSDGAVTKCMKTSTEGTYSPITSTCDFFGPRQFKASEQNPIWATTSLSIYAEP